MTDLAKYTLKVFPNAFYVQIIIAPMLCIDMGVLVTMLRSIIVYIRYDRVL